MHFFMNSIIYIPNKNMENSMLNMISNDQQMMIMQEQRIMQVLAIYLSIYQSIYLSIFLSIYI